jgi:hypothetical protein
VMPGSVHVISVAARTNAGYQAAAELSRVSCLKPPSTQRLGFAAFVAAKPFAATTSQQPHLLVLVLRTHLPCLGFVSTPVKTTSCTAKDYGRDDIAVKISSTRIYPEISL